MSENAACPDRNTLKELLLGKLPKPELEALGEHLLQCERCTKSADTIVAEDDLTTAIHSRRILKGDEEVLARILERGKRLISQAETVIPDAAGTAEDNIDPNATKIGMLGDHGDDEFGFLAPAQESDEIGRLGDYRILQVLGIGGMGVVFRAEDSRLKRQVAIKVMKPTVASSRSAKDRFIREAQFTAAIEHDNIVQIYQVGEDNGVPFIAMPFLKGESLKKRLERKGRLPQADVIKIGIQVAAGLAAAHERNLIHRDIKPDNLWLEEKTGRVKILDFGLVRAFSEDAGLTQSGAVMGTPRYMAPEQAMGESIDSRCDLFSLGSVLYHLVTGKLPFEGANVTATLMAVVHQEPRPLDSVAEGLHPDLVQLINRLLAKDRNNRPAKASEVAKWLTAIHQQLKRDAAKPAKDEPRVDDAESPKLVPQPLVSQPKSGKEMPLPVSAAKAASAPPSGPPKKRMLQAAGAGGILLVMLGVLIYTITDKDGNKTVVKAPSGTPVEFDLEPGSKLNVREESEAVKSSTASNSPSQISEPSAGWHGWPADAPKPAIAPFDADQAKKHQEEWAAYLKVPVEQTVEMHDNLTMQFVLIPPGEFQMGSPIDEFGRSENERQHSERLVTPYFVGKDEVTQWQFLRVMGFNPSQFGAADAMTFPVENVSWYDAIQFCNFMSSASGIVPAYKIEIDEKTGDSITKANVTPTTDEGFRLLQQREWEYSCRAGTLTAFSFGNSITPQQANFNCAVNGGYGPISPNDYRQRTVSIDTFAPNPWGLRNMHGNVWEFCCDQPSTSTVNQEGVFRGGNWQGASMGARSACSIAYTPDRRTANGGIRVALSIEAMRLLRSQTKKPKPLREGMTSVPPTLGWQGWPENAPKPAITPFNADQANAYQDNWAAYLNVPVEYTNSIGMKFRLIPPGEFIMGTSREEVDTIIATGGFSALIPAEKWAIDHLQEEMPARTIRLTMPFYVSVNEVRNRDFQEFTALTDFKTDAEKDGKGGTIWGEEKGDWIDDPKAIWRSPGHDSPFELDLPVCQVSAHDAEAFCKWLSTKDAMTYRLCSEAEWEYMATAGTRSTFSMPAKEATTITGGILRAVGATPANAFGIHDVDDGMQEWIADDSQPDADGRFSSEVPREVIPSGMRLLRGGTSHCSPFARRRSLRQRMPPSYRRFNIGFRVMLSVDTVKAAKAQVSTGNPPGSKGWHGWPADAPKPAIAPFDADQAKKHQEEWAAYLKVPVEYTNSIGMKLRLIPPGEFMMGVANRAIADAGSLVSEEWSQKLRRSQPEHRVVISQPFYLSMHETTQSQVINVMGRNPFHFCKSGKGKELIEDLNTDQHPAEMISFHDAVEFANLLSITGAIPKVYIVEGSSLTRENEKGYRLPTEAEWEYAVRAGSSMYWYFGGDKSRLRDVAWIAENSAGATHPVGQLAANPFGLYDVYGNVCEWCEDWFDATGYQTPTEVLVVDPRGPTSGEKRVIRGSGWFGDSIWSFSGWRDGIRPDYRYNDNGVRLVLSVDAVKQLLK